MCPLPVLLSVVPAATDTPVPQGTNVNNFLYVPAATDRKGAEGVRKIGRLQAADFPNGADSGTLDSLFFGMFDS